MARQLRSHVATGLTGFLIGSATIVLWEEKKREEISFLPSAWNVKHKDGFIVSYDRRLRNPNWVYERLDREALRKKQADRARHQFKIDSSTPKQFQVRPTDFSQSGYDRGHLAPARDMVHSEKAMQDSFLMTNISPQVGRGFNRDYWSRFEGFIRTLTLQYAQLHVVTGPLYLPQVQSDGRHMVQYPVIGSPPRIAVPTHFFKVIYAEKSDGGMHSVGFVVPNASIPKNKQITSFIVPIEEIEDVSGLLFFQQISRSQLGPLCQNTKCKLPDWKKSIKSSNYAIKDTQPSVSIK